MHCWQTAVHRDVTRNQVFDAVRRVLKSAPDWGARDGSRSYQKKKWYVDLLKVAIVILKDISLLIISRCYFSRVATYSYLFHELGWCVNSYTFLVSN